MLTSEDNVFSFKMEKCDKAKKEIKFLEQKGRNKLPVFADDMIVYVEYSKESTREILGPTCEFSKVAEYTDNV